MINHIRNYFNRLVKNTRNDNIKFFSNIELGTDKDKPHLHIQVWHDNQKQMNKIYDKVISRFGLFSEYCKLTMPEDDTEIYDYVIKDYRKGMSDDELLSLYDAKRTYRGVLDKKIRFSSHSKSKYTKAIYKSLYSKFDLKKDTVDLMLDNNIIDIRGNVNSSVIYALYILFYASFNTSNNKRESIDCFHCNLVEFLYLTYFEYWIFGKLWRYLTFLYFISYNFYR